MMIFKNQIIISILFNISLKYNYRYHIQLGIESSQTSAINYSLFIYLLNIVIISFKFFINILVLALRLFHKHLETLILY